MNNYRKYWVSLILLYGVFLISCKEQTQTPVQFPTEIYNSGKVKHFEFQKIPFDTLNEGVLRKLVYGDNLQQTDVIIKKGYSIPKHDHVSEQMSTILKGSFKATVFYADKTEVTILKAGDVFFIPSNIPHLYEALEDSEVLETFFPVRLDMISK